MIPGNTVQGQSPNAVIAVHNGALGDFLCCWPGLLAIARHFTVEGENNSRPLYFMGPDARLPWLAPLGYTPCPSELRAAMESLYTTQAIPATLKGGIIFWFCLDKPPQLPCLPQNRAMITPLPILLPPGRTYGNLGGAEQMRPPHVLLTLKNHLTEQGLPWPEDWPNTWQALFGGWEGQNSKEIALLPGSGHRNKEWPLRHFETLANMLTAQGWDPLFIIGEAELERGLKPPRGMRCESPSPPAILAERLRKVRAVVSNDAGPAHLAGMYNIPGVVIFGPTSPEIWGVPGLINLMRHGICRLNQRLEAVRTSTPSFKLNFKNQLSAPQPAPLPCSPCRVMPKDISCPEPLCLNELSPAVVFEVLNTLLHPAAA